MFVLKASGPRRVELVAGRPQTIVGVGGPWPVDLVTDRVLAIVRERYPSAQIIDTPFEEAGAAMAVARGGDRITISLRLARLDGVALVTVGELEYRVKASGVAAAFSRTDERAGRLLDDRFRDAILRLIN